MTNDLHLETNGANPYVFPVGDVLVHVHITPGTPVPPVQDVPKTPEGAAVGKVETVRGRTYVPPPMRVIEPVDGEEGADELLLLLGESAGSGPVRVKSIDGAGLGRLIIGLQSADLSGFDLRIGRLEGSEWELDG